jgi:Na+-driven multidrug efflux pump
LAATLASNAINLVLEPILIFHFGWGVRGAAGAIVAAQFMASAGLLYALNCRIKLQFSPVAMSRTLQYLKPTGFLILRTMTITSTFAIATSEQ